MLKIGFTNKYFTLWDVSSEDSYSTFNGKHYKSHTTTHFTYHQNLSMTESEAKKKASDMGCTELSVDSDLRGKHNSWNSVKRYERPSYDVNQFTYGKYAGDIITESTDTGYLVWYSSDADCKVSRKRVCELDSNMCIWENRLITKDERTDYKKRVKLIKKFVKDGSLEVVIESNISDYGHKEFRTNVGRFELEPDLKVKELWYREFSYYLPVNEKGKSFRIKNKTAKIYRSDNKDEYGDYYVSKIEIIKK